jgi:hypothetical protein
MFQDFSYSILRAAPVCAVTALWVDSACRDISVPWCDQVDFIVAFVVILLIFSLIFCD